MVSMVGGGISGCCLTARRNSFSSAPTRGDVTPNFDRRVEEGAFGWLSAAIARRGSSISDKFNRRRRGVNDVGVEGNAGLSGVVGVEDRLGVSERAESVSIDSGAGRDCGVGR